MQSHETTLNQLCMAYLGSEVRSRINNSSPLAAYSVCLHGPLSRFLLRSFWSKRKAQPKSEKETAEKNIFDFIFLNFFSLFFGVAVPRPTKTKTNPVYGRRVNSFVLVCSLSSHRHSYIPVIFDSRFIDS